MEQKAFTIIAVSLLLNWLLLWCTHFFLPNVKPIIVNNPLGHVRQSLKCVVDTPVCEWKTSAPPLNAEDHQARTWALCVTLSDEKSYRCVGWNALALQTYSILSSVAENGYNNNQENNSTYFKSQRAKTVSNRMCSAENGYTKCTHHSSCRIIHSGGILSDCIPLLSHSAIKPPK